MLHGRIAAETVGRGFFEECPQRQRIESSKALSIQRAPRVRAVKASVIDARRDALRAPNGKNSIDRGRRCVARAPEIPHDPGDTTLSFGKGSARI